MTEAFLPADVWRLIRRRGILANINVRIGGRAFRATGITHSLEHLGTLEKAQPGAPIVSPRTTKLQDRTSDEISPDEVETIGIRSTLIP